MTPVYTDADLLNFTLATWVFELHVAGVSAKVEAIAAACAAVEATSDPEAGEAAGVALVAAVAAKVTGADPAQIAAFASDLYPGSVATDLGAGDRDARLVRIRRHQFGHRLPWLARVWERDGVGRVRPSWGLIEQVTDEVTLADPNPWNDVDELRRVPVADFQVLWELADCASVAVQR